MVYIDKVDTADDILELFESLAISLKGMSERGYYNNDYLEGVAGGYAHSSREVRSLIKTIRSKREPNN